MTLSDDFYGEGSVPATWHPSERRALAVRGNRVWKRTGAVFSLLGM